MTYAAVMQTLRQRTPLGVLTLLFASIAHADIYHDNNILSGTRAAGLGGAFTAISNDPSGLVYNPGGMGFAKTSDISASVNAYSEKRTTHSKVLGGDDFFENSSGIVAPFFGGLKHLKNFGPFSGFSAGFAVAVPDNDSQDQNDYVKDKPSIYVIRYHRTQNMRGSNMLALGGAGANFGDVFGLGIGGGYRRIDELTQSFQDSKLGVYTAREGDSTGLPAGTRFISNLSQNIRYNRRIESIEGNIGFLFKFGKSGLSLGGSFVRTYLWAQLIDQSTEYLNFYSDESGEILSRRISPTGAATSVEDATSSKDSFYSTTSIISLPDRYRLGLAWEKEKLATISVDATYSDGLLSDITQLKRDPIWNAHAGIELNFLSPIVARYGIFTNNDAAPGSGKAKVNARGEYLDYLGHSASIGIHPQGVEYTLTGCLQDGKGQAVKIPGRYNNVTSRIITIAFSISHESK